MGQHMLSIRGRYADFYVSQIDTSDYKNLEKNGLDSSLVYDRLDDMNSLTSGISSTDIKIWIDDKCVIG